MNYRQAAIQIDDLLKYSTTINEINRLAGSIFRFQHQHFPNEAITSKRAQLFYDWVLSLAKQKMAEGQRNQLLIRFSQSLTPEELRGDVSKILLEAGTPANLVNREDYLTFTSRNFHRQVVTHSQKLFLQGNYFHAVFEASKAYNLLVKEKAQSAKDGATLMLTVWGCENGVLKVTPCASDTDRNVQDGIKFLSAGLMRAIRNPTAHEPALHWPISKQDCLDILSFISFLFRQLDESVYYAN